MDFKYQFPERADQSPGAGGRTGSIEASKLSLLRRSQLVWLAKAFDVDIPPDAPKAVILPMLEIAQGQGQLRKIEDDYAYFRAHYNSDTPHPPNHPVFESTQPLSRPPQPDYAANSEHRQLQQECKRLGIKCFGWGTQQMRDAIARLGDLKEREIDAHPDPS
jgi:hypothetical protein